MELKILNSMEIVDFDIQDGSVVYLAVSDNEENIEKLFQLGISDKEIELWKDENVIDITYMTIEFWNYWSKEKGFEVR